jgi:DNA primase
LRFAFLPDGEDPDSLLARHGAPALAQSLDKLESLVDFLWRREASAGPVDTPERRAALRRRLDQAAAQIRDRDLRADYMGVFRQRFDQAFGSARAGRGRMTDLSARRPPTPVPAAALANLGENERRERVLVATVLNHPALLERIEEDFAGCPIESHEADSLRRAILDIWATSPGLDSAGLNAQLIEAGHGARIERLFGRGSFAQLDRALRFVATGADLSEAEIGWRDTLALHTEMRRRRDHERATSDYIEDSSEENLARMNALGHHTR